MIVGIWGLRWGVGEEQTLESLRGIGRVGMTLDPV